MQEKIVTLRSPALVAKSQTQAVYERLRKDIVACRLAPAQKLKIADLCERFGASLGAVREALSRLTADGLVLAEAQKGYQVAPMSLAELDDLTITRIEIEELCIRKSLARGDVHWESQLLSAHHLLSRTSAHGDSTERGVSDDWSNMHTNFHHAVVAACGSPWLLRLRTVLCEQTERYRRFSASATAEDRDLPEEHKNIFEAALARDADTTIKLVVQHFTMTADLVRLADFESQKRGIRHAS